MDLLNIAYKLKSVLQDQIIQIQKRSKDDQESKKTTRQEVADHLGVSAKTLYNWLNLPQKYEIPLNKVIQICELLDVNPEYVLFEFECSDYNKTEDPVGAEKMLYDLEVQLNTSNIRKVVYGPMSSVCQKQPLSVVFAFKSLSKRFDTKQQRMGKSRKNIYQEYFDVREERKKLFLSKSYRLQHIMQRDELENWLNGKKLYKNLSADLTSSQWAFDEGNIRKRLKCQIQQIEHLINLCNLSVRIQGKSISTLELRLSKSYFRAQYGIYPIPKNPEVVVNSNQGYFKYRGKRIASFYENEFDHLWDANCYQQLTTKIQLIKFFKFILVKLQYYYDKGGEPDFNLKYELEDPHGHFGYNK